MEQTADPPLIICFGDSLTAGYQSPTPACPVLRETPYGVRLQERLGSSARVAVSGVCGEVTGEMALRFPSDVLARRPDSVVILGGTNDLGGNAEPSEIMRNLLHMYGQAVAAGIRPVAVTVPSIRIEASTKASHQFLRDHLARRQALNSSISEYCAQQGIPCVDLFTATVEKDTLCLAAPFSNDGLHLTTDGYATLADLLYEQVFGSRFRPFQAGQRNASWQSYRP
ncbi:MAG: SGNH/GDSL hydrolase family protein [Nitrospiraceae bacterium]